MHQQFDALRAASRAQPAPDARSRRAALTTLERLVTENAGRIAAAIDADFAGRSRTETLLLEVTPLLTTLRHSRRHLARWMRTGWRWTGWQFWPGASRLRREPLGVVGIISPWNYPLLLALGPLVDALAAGNRAMLKPSELTPTFSALLAELIAAHFPPDQVTVVTGGPDVAAAFSTLPFNHLVFTGSTAVGRRVMAAAAPNLTPVTLELGGKSPAVVLPGFDLARAARSIAFGKLLNAGQTCIAPDYALVPRGQARAFAAAVIAAAQERYPRIESNPDYSSIITSRHRDRLLTALQEAEAGGASVISHDDHPVRGIAPTVVLDAPEDCLLLREEIFGPILPVLEYDDIPDALRLIALRERPLALYAFGNRQDQTRILNGAISGGVTLNGTLLHIAQDSLPFGGIGPSGMGAYHGRAGFERLSHARAVFRPGRPNLFEMLGPPWRGRAASVIRLLTGRLK